MNIDKFEDILTECPRETGSCYCDNNGDEQCEECNVYFFLEDVRDFALSLSKLARICKRLRDGENNLQTYTERDGVLAEVFGDED